MHSNGLSKKLGLVLTAFVLLVTAISGYAIMHHQVGEHEVRIEKVEGAQTETGKRLERIETMQEVQIGYTKELRDDVKELIRRGVP